MQQCTCRKNIIVSEALFTKTLNILYIKGKESDSFVLTKSLLFVFGLPFILFAVAGLSYKLTLSSLRTRGINHTFVGHSWLGGSLASFCPCLRAMSVNIYCEVRGCQKHLCFSHFCCQVVSVDTKCVWGLATFGPLSALFIWGKK